MAARWRSGEPLPEGVRRDRIEPLWERVDRNRAKLAFFIAAYLLSIAVSAGLMAALSVIVTAVFFMPALWTPSLGSLVRGAFLVASGAALVVGSVWVAYAVLRSERRLLAHLGAVLTPTGEYLPTKMALKDMAIAAGFDHAPGLWVISDCERINAFSVGRTHRSSVVGVTQGFVDRLDEDEQRAVFANLMARLCNGDVRVATAISGLVGPIWRLREKDLRGDDPIDRGIRAAMDDVEPSSIGRGPGDARLIAGYFILYVFLIVITELLALGHQKQALLTAEKADAEGMLLLKDPREMLRALEKVLDANNTVPSAGEAYSDLFYCWAGYGFAPEDDPEYQRVARLREVLGIEGLIDSPSAEDYSLEGAVAPVAPRVEQGEDPAAFPEDPSGRGGASS